MVIARAPQMWRRLAHNTHAAGQVIQMYGTIARAHEAIFCRTLQRMCMCGNFVNQFSLSVVSVVRRVCVCFFFPFLSQFTHITSTRFIGGRNGRNVIRTRTFRTSGWKEHAQKWIELLNGEITYTAPPRKTMANLNRVHSQEDNLMWLINCFTMKWKLSEVCMQNANTPPDVNPFFSDFARAYE